MKDRISTNTNLLVFNRERHMRTMLELIPVYARNGMKILDLNFCEMMNPVSVLKDRRKAKEYINRLEEYKSELGVEYVQCHLPYPRSMEVIKESNEEIKIALEYVSELGIPTSVIHPIIGTIEDNIAYFESFKEYIPSSTTLAIENMETKSEIYSIDQILAIINGLSFKSGICLDTGHANMTGIDIPEFIKKANKHLIATHIADNDGKVDQHLLPGFGNIEWEAAVHAFKEYYSGYLNYEAMYFSKNLPKKLENEVASLAKSIGSWLISL